MFFYIYLLRSLRDERFYIGFTTDIGARLEKHNLGKVYWTKRSLPWKLVYYEAYISKMDALTREKQLKRFAKGFAQLRRRLPGTLKLQR
ncbi:MAG: hypothetical protein A2122_01010 [Candidatus Liptonbacteria bacterium GWB1_49_6]|uniref:GIY-YIG domain-containing protein n=1 Tax=Candidatus Liptonbacteria bacterium GWB1_49_6 TaxID=1798644 RepID=A0A1G2C5J2_9BACT|nr:MAG: hypothetical protein A2122_01010 [Candidatus Liptonbacteria bacterium GWB1_49_6]